jgi:hypothetical protein
MKQAFISEKYGTLTLSVLRDANPRMQITVDLGLPTFPQFSLTLPFPETEALNSNYIFSCGVALLVEQMHIFLNERGFVETVIVGLMESLYLALEQYKVENKEAFEEGDPCEVHEVKFGVSVDFYREVQEHLVSNKQAAPYVNHAKEFELRLKKRQMDKSQETKAKEEAGEIISRFKNNIYKNTPGQLFVTLYDRNGKPAGVARVTNQGLTKFAEEKEAATWKNFVRGEYWLNSDNGHYMDCQTGDYNHESYAQETIICGRWDDIKQALEENYLRLKSMNPDLVARETGVEIEELAEEWREIASVNDPLTNAVAWDFQYTSLWTSLPEQEQNELFNNDYELYRRDIRYFFMKHYNEIRVINNNFEVWKLTSQNMNAITSFILEMAGDRLDNSAELMIEEVSTKRWASVPLGEFLNMKHPGQMWRAHGTVLAGKVAFAEFRAKELEVGDYYTSPENQADTMKVLTKDMKNGFVFLEVEMADGEQKSIRYDANKILYLGRSFAKTGLFNPETFTFSRTQFSNKPLPRGMYKFKMDEEKKTIYQESIQLPPPEPEHRASKTAAENVYMVDEGDGTPQFLNIELESRFGNWHLRVKDSAEAEWIIADIELDSIDRPMTAKGKNSWDLERDLKSKIDWHYIMLKKDLKREIESGHKPKYTYHDLELDNARLIQEMIYEVERHLGPEQPKTRW